jgi:hypothetical protein
MSGEVDTFDEELEAEAGGSGAGAGGRNGNVSLPPDDEEPVGYKRPPKRHQFPPGRSGNPRGRPRGAKGLKQILQSEFAERIVVTKGDTRLKISKLQMIVKRELEKALAGDQRAIEHLISLNIQMFGLGPEEPKEEVELTLGEELYMDALMKRLGPQSDEEAGHQGDAAATGGNHQEDEDEDE